MKDFLAEENEKRIGHYHKTELLEETLLKINQELKRHEIYNIENAEYTNVYLCGLPRSGTTLTSQIIARGLGLSYINNLSARFWLAPIQGILFSQAVIGNEKLDLFESDYGKSIELNGIHEFMYFWYEVLNIESVNDLITFNAPSNEVDWKQISSILAGMQKVTNTGFIFMTNIVMNFLEDFCKNLGNSIIVYIERDIESVALSILRARKKYYGNSNTWWATHSPNYFTIKDLTFDEQIAHQVLSLRETYDEALKLVDDNMVIRVNYEEVCSNPSFLLKKIAHVSKELYGTEISVDQRVPSSFEIRRNTALNSDEMLLLETLNKI